MAENLPIFLVAVLVSSCVMSWISGKLTISFTYVCCTIFLNNIDKNDKGNFKCSRRSDLS